MEFKLNKNAASHWSTAVKDAAYRIGRGGPSNRRKESMQPSEPKFVSVCESVGVFGLGDCKLEASTVLPLMNCVCCTTGVAIVKKSCHRPKPVNGP